MKKEFGDYYLGLDIGTDSVGWAVTDLEYNILEFNRKAMWGIHLFKSGETAQERRMYRTARRRLSRRKERLNHLRNIFKDEINKVDPDFYKKLDTSYLQADDREKGFTATLFNKKSPEGMYLSDKPTIYHIRYDLMNTKVKPDIRFVYLALHHILKYRGHFLFEGLSDDADIPDFECVFNEFQTYLADEFGIDLSVEENIPEIKEVLLNEDMGIGEKSKELKRLISAESQEEEALMNLLAGGKVSLEKIFNEEELKDVKVTFKGNSFEDNRIEIESALDSEKMQLIDIMKQIYDWSVIAKLLADSKTISETKIKQYDQHKKDLRLLKSVVKKHSMDVYGDSRLYNEVFKDDVKNNYCYYSGVIEGLKDVKNNKCTQEDFCAFIRGVLKEFDFEQNDSTRNMKERLEKNTFMPKQTSKENSTIPNSLHRRELKAILENMLNFYPFLGIKDEDGLSPKEKIEVMCSFRIPYYVGPLNPDSKNFWAVRDNTKRVTPWNFEDVVDLDKSSVNFIEELISSCEMIKGEKVVPKNSILYSRYMLYNELNIIRINGERIDPELKKKIVCDIFEKDVKGRVDAKKLKEYISAETGLSDVEIEGINVDIKARLKSESQLRKILGAKADKTREMEELIKIITIFGDDRKRLKLKLEADYSDKYSEEEINALSKLKYDGWGRFSERFLSGITHNFPDGRTLNIINAMFETNRNLNELLSKEYSYSSQVRKINATEADEKKNNISYEIVENLYCSPAVKRGIWRALSIVKEILKVTGHPPKKIFIETTRENQEIKKRTVSRKENLRQLFKECKNQERDWIGEIDRTDEARFRGKKLYAYYTQMGRCMYCGKMIDLESLGQDNYDIDHIIPRSIKYDDSPHNNLVLTCRICNDTKDNNYPIPQEWQERMASFWRYLLECKLITEEKYKRLTRKHELTDSERAEFISRQLVETSQSVKAVAEAMKYVFGEESDIVYVKGNNVSRFRSENGYVKVRSVNDYHHAKDAYLNIVVGNVYDVKFTKNPIRIVSSEKYNLNRTFDFNVERNGVVAWVAGEGGTSATVAKYMRRNNIRFTTYPYKSTGKLFDLNLLKKGKGQHPPSSGLDVEKYGGYNNVKGSYFALVEHGSGKKRIRTLEHIPIMDASDDLSGEKLREYFVQKGFENPDVRVECIKMDSVFEINGFRMILSARTGPSIVFSPGEQLIIPYDTYDYCKKIEKVAALGKKAREEAKMTDYGIQEEANIKTFDIFIEKLGGLYGKVQSLSTQHKKLMEKREVFLSKDPMTQAAILGEILHLFQCNATRADLSEIGGSSQAGVVKINQNLKYSESVYLINQSPAGLFENKVNLKTV